MMLTHLIPLSQFVDKIDEIVPRKKELSATWRINQLRAIKRYTAFLLQSLELKMFVPVSDSGEVLEEPKKPHTFASENSENYMNQYLIEKDNLLKAKEKCLFEGWNVIGIDDEHIELEKAGQELWLNFYEDGVFAINYDGDEDEIKTVEDLLKYCTDKGIDLPLTAKAIKQILG